MNAVAGEHGPDERASLRRRVAALAYELLLLAALLLVAGFALLPFSAHPAGESRLLVPGSTMRMVSFGVLFLVLAGYCAYFWSGGRRTLPMRTWHLRLVDWRGADLTVSRALVRFAAAWISPALAVGAYALGAGRHAAWLLAFNVAWACVDPDRQFLHDRIAGTRVRREPHASAGRR